MRILSPPAKHGHGLRGERGTYYLMALPEISDEYIQISRLFLRYWCEIGLKPLEVMLILVLLDEEEDGLIAPTRGRLAERLGITRAYVDRMARDLEARGILRREERFAHPKYPMTEDERRNLLYEDGTPVSPGMRLPSRWDLHPLYGRLFLVDHGERPIGPLLRVVKGEWKRRKRHPYEIEIRPDVAGIVEDPSV